MREFIFTGTLELHGVQFFVVAENEAEAMAKAKSADYVSYDTDAAAMVNCTLDTGSLEPNE